MTLTLDTPLMGTGEWSASDIDAAFSHYGNDPAGLGEQIVYWGTASGVNSDFLTCQIADESGWWTSEYATMRNNPSGFGAVDSNPDAALHFPNLSDGIRATVAHWLTYIMGDSNPLKAADPRFSLVPSDHKGIANLTIAGIGGGVWASAPDYPLAIMNRYMEMVDFLGKPDDNGNENGGKSVVKWIDGTDVPVPTEDDLGVPVTVEWLPAFGENRLLTDIEWWVVHDTEGGDVAGAMNAMKANGASAHAVIDRDGALTFCVPLGVTAYAAGNLPVNNASINVEQVGYAAHDGYTDAQYATMARFFVWCQAQGVTNIPATYIGHDDADGGPEPDNAGILGHMDVPRDDGKPGWGGNDGHTDPGPSYDFGKLEAMIGSDAGQSGGGATTGGGGSGANDGVSTVAVAGGEVQYVTLTGDDRGVRVSLPGASGNTGTYGIGHGFLDRWLNEINPDRNPETVFLAATERDGWPLTDEFGYAYMGKAYTVQVFERAVYTWDGETVDALDLGRLFLHNNMAAMPANAWR